MLAVTSCNAATSVCMTGGKWEPALSFWSSIPIEQMTPDEISYSAAISASENGDQSDWALSFLSAMTPSH